MIEELATSLGASEASIRLLISLFIPYLMSPVYKLFVQNQSVDIKHYFIIVCGIFLNIFNYGSDLYHSLVAVTFTYVMLKIIQPSGLNVIINFMFHMTYLVAGYWYNANDIYDFTWTMPHCVLTLKLIGLSFDLWDGTKDPETLSKSFKKTALKREPTFVDIMSFVFFPPSYLIGPQFTMVKYYEYIEGKFDKAYDMSAIKEAFTRCILGILYLGMFQIGSSYVNEHLFMTDYMKNSSFIFKHLCMALLAKIFITKYVSCWLITEGACILFGLAYNGRDENGATLWNGCRNVHLGILERLTKYNHYVECFNVNTNAWVAQNIYKRMIFLNNPKISRLGTLMFLAVWHGVYSGYYMAFVMQFFIIIMEKDIEQLIIPKYFPKLLTLHETSYMFCILRFVFLKLYSTMFLSYCIIPFTLLRFDRWWPVYQSLNYSGFIIFVPYFFLYRPILLFLCKKYIGQRDVNAAVEKKAN